MVIASRKSPSVKQWAVSVMSFAIGFNYYRELKSMERGIDLIATECAKRGGCAFNVSFDY